MLQQGHFNDTLPHPSASPLWNFVHWDSIWPLPHVILAYHAYLYTRNWISVLCFYYLLKTAQLLLFSFMGIGYDHYFAEILNGRELTYYHQQHDSSNRDNPPAEDYGCLVDFNGLFVGGTIQTLLGIMLGMIHSYLYAPYIHKVKNFYPVTFWKSPATKHDHKFKLSKEIVEKHTKVHNVWARYGMWPWYLWFGRKKSKRVLSGELQHFQIHLQRRWKFRSYFWQRWLQLTLLGSPCLLFYTIGGENVLRVGSVAYGFITCSLLLWYRLWNESYFIKKLTKKTTSLVQSRTTIILDVDSDLGLFPIETTISGSNFIILLTLKHDIGLIFNSYDTVYSAWILTCVILIGFQSLHIPSLTAFFKVIISSVSVALLSLFLSKLPYFMRYFKYYY